MLHYAVRLAAVNRSVTAICSSVSVGISQRWRTRQAEDVVNRMTEALESRVDATHQCGRVPRKFVGVGFIDPDSLSERDVDVVDPGRVQPYYTKHVPRRVTMLISPGPLKTRPITPLPRPTTTVALFQNLVYMLSYHPQSPPPLGLLVSYHTSFPFLQSTKSYNLLISLALRLASFRTAERLLRVMRVRGVRVDLETWKLRIRWLVRCSRWDEAWSEVMRVIGEPRDARVQIDGFRRAKGGMPLPIWMELFGSAKRGAFKWRGRGLYLTKRERDKLECNPVVDAARFKLLIQNPPELTNREFGQIPPRAVYLAVHMLLRMNEREEALEFTKSYLKGLPTEMDDRWSRKCLEIIHLHIIFDRQKRGLSAFHSTRMTTNTLLAMCRGVRANSTTLFLMLRQLKYTKRCGYMAYGYLGRFKSRWGAAVEDQRVRRRVASLALKEGRLDIAKKMVVAERRERWRRGTWWMRKSVLGGRDGKRYEKLLRVPSRRIFGRKGVESYRWKVVRRRMSRMKRRAL